MKSYKQNTIYTVNEHDFYCQCSNGLTSGNLSKEWIKYQKKCNKEHNYINRCRKNSWNKAALIPSRIVYIHIYAYAYVL